MAIIRGDQSDDILYGTDEGDGMRGYGGSDILYGRRGDDQLDGGTGADRLIGRTGDDTYWIDDPLDVTIEKRGEGFADQVRSTIDFVLSKEIENLFLEGDADIGGTGNDQDNIIVGNDGGNRLDGGEGADILDGGLGNDIYVIRNLGERIIEREGGGFDTIVSLVTYDLDQNATDVQIENLKLGGMVVNGGGDEAANIISGNSANNTLSGDGGDDVLIGSGGSDYLFGGNGSDLMRGGTGSDTYSVADLGDTVRERIGRGVDLVQSSIDYRLTANVENLTLVGSDSIDGTGNSLSNKLIGNSGANILDGRGGADIMSGGAGADTYIVDHVDDVIAPFTGSREDQIFSSVSFTIKSFDVVRLKLVGNEAIDGWGSGAGEAITGNEQANRIDGKGGFDNLRGRGGEDGFYFTLQARSYRAKILDFSTEDDTIFLSTAHFDGPDGTLSEDAFHEGTAAQDAGDRILYDSQTGNIYYDSDGSGAQAAILFATVTAGTALTREDFVLFTG
jgi:Ca2+-binding RTX toxin-like protein